MSRYYSGPVSDHFDGERFFDPQGAPLRGRPDLRRWLVDRYWRGTRGKRGKSPGFSFFGLPPIYIVLVSHAHYDHLDVTTLSRLASAHRARVITALGNDTIMRAHDKKIAAEAYDWLARVVIGQSVTLTLVPPRHWSARNPSDRNMALWASFVI